MGACRRVLVIFLVSGFLEAVTFGLAVDRVTRSYKKSEDGGVKAEEQWKQAKGIQWSSGVMNGAVRFGFGTLEPFDCYLPCAPLYFFIF